MTWRKEPPTADEVRARGIAGAALASAREAAHEVARVALTYGAAVVVGLAIEAVAWIEERRRPA